MYGTMSIHKTGDCRFHKKSPCRKRVKDAARYECRMQGTVLCAEPNPEFLLSQTQNDSSFPKKTELFLTTQRTVPCATPQQFAKSHN